MIVAILILLALALVEYLAYGKAESLGVLISIPIVILMIRTAMCHL